MGSVCGATTEGGWGGHEGSRQYGFRSKGHRKERVPFIISGETSAGCLTFVSYLFVQYSPTAFLDARCALKEELELEGLRSPSSQTAGQRLLLCLSACHGKANLVAIPNSLAQELAKVLKTSSMQPCSSWGAGGALGEATLSVTPLPSQCPSCPTSGSCPAPPWGSWTCHLRPPAPADCAVKGLCLLGPQEQTAEH